jgi:prepilin-type N-terminal cleavage/methylation domain-containing protein
VRTTGTKPRGRRAFTLIELLVVVLIIALLMGILIPSLAATRATAKRLKCLTNLKSFGIALENYRRDSRNDLLPHVLPFHDSRFPANEQDPQLLDVLRTYMDIPPPERVNPDDPNSPFYEVEPYRCPADPETAKTTGFSYEYWAGVLMIAREIFRADPNPAFTVSRFYEFNPTFPVLADASGWHPGSVEANQNALYFGDWRADWLVTDPSTGVPSAPPLPPVPPGGGGPR